MVLKNKRNMILLFHSSFMVLFLYLSHTLSLSFFWFNLSLSLSRSVTKHTFFYPFSSSQCRFFLSLSLSFFLSHSLFSLFVSCYLLSLSLLFSLTLSHSLSFKQKVSDYLSFSYLPWWPQQRLTCTNLKKKERFTFYLLFLRLNCCMQPCAAQKIFD